MIMIETAEKDNSDDIKGLQGESSKQPIANENRHLTNTMNALEVLSQAC